jgi:hypothetical protein
MNTSVCQADFFHNVSLNDKLATFKNLPLAMSGDNVLLEFNGKYTLMKYDSFDTATDPKWSRLNRGVVVPRYHSGIDALFSLDIFGTHALQLVFDDEFKIYLPQSNNDDIYMDLAQRTTSGELEPLLKSAEFFFSDTIIAEKLKQMVRPDYFINVIEPFLESKPAKYLMPTFHPDSLNTIIRNKSNFAFRKMLPKRYAGLHAGLTPLGSGNVSINVSIRDKAIPEVEINSKIACQNTLENTTFPPKAPFMRDRWDAQNYLNDVAKGLNHGDFCYIGCKEEVYLIGIAKNGETIASQGTYMVSTKPLFSFSNSLLGCMSVYDLERPLCDPDARSVNAARYRTFDPPAFNGKFFVFPAMRREQDCKNTMFMGKPQLITGDLTHAINHFRTTDFAEFEDILIDYARNMYRIIDGVGKKGNVNYF